MKRFFFLSTLTVILGFGGGFFIGQSSEQTLTQMGILNEPISLLVDGELLLNENLRAELELESGLRVKILAAKSFEDFKKFSEVTLLWIGRTCWIERLNTNSEINHLFNEAWVKTQISPDFLTLEHQETQTLPLLWSFGKAPHATEISTTNLLHQKIYPIILFGIRLDSSIDKSVSQKLTKVLTSRDWNQRWIESIPIATTYMTLDESLVEKSQKASFFRELDFRKIGKVTPESPACDEFQFKK